jgi:hypothetical protein
MAETSGSYPAPAKADEMIGTESSAVLACVRWYCLPGERAKWNAASGMCAENNENASRVFGESPYIRAAGRRRKGRQVEGEP